MDPPQPPGFPEQDNLADLDGDFDFSEYLEGSEYGHIALFEDSNEVFAPGQTIDQIDTPQNQASGNETNVQIGNPADLAVDQNTDSEIGNLVNGEAHIYGDFQIPDSEFDFQHPDTQDTSDPAHHQDDTYANHDYEMGNNEFGLEDPGTEVGNLLNNHNVNREDSRADNNELPLQGADADAQNGNLVNHQLGGFVDFLNNDNDFDLAFRELGAQIAPEETLTFETNAAVRQHGQTDSLFTSDPVLAASNNLTQAVHQNGQLDSLYASDPLSAADNGFTVHQNDQITTSHTQDPFSAAPDNGFTVHQNGQITASHTLNALSAAADNRGNVQGQVYQQINTLYASDPFSADTNRGDVQGQPYGQFGSFYTLQALAGQNVQENGLTSLENGETVQGQTNDPINRLNDFQAPAGQHVQENGFTTFENGETVQGQIYGPIGTLNDSQALAGQHVQENGLTTFGNGETVQGHGNALSGALVAPPDDETLFAHAFPTWPWPQEHGVNENVQHTAGPESVSGMQRSPDLNQPGPSSHQVQTGAEQHASSLGDETILQGYGNNGHMNMLFQPAPAAPMQMQLNTLGMNVGGMGQDLIFPENDPTLPFQYAQARGMGNQNTLTFEIAPGQNPFFPYNANNIAIPDASYGNAEMNAYGNHNYTIPSAHGYTGSVNLQAPQTAVDYTQAGEPGWPSLAFLNDPVDTGSNLHTGSLDPAPRAVNANINGNDSYSFRFGNPTAISGLSSPFGTGTQAMQDMQTGSVPGSMGNGQRVPGTLAHNILAVDPTSYPWTGTTSASPNMTMMASNPFATPGGMIIMLPSNATNVGQAPPPTSQPPSTPVAQSIAPVPASGATTGSTRRRNRARVPRVRDVMPRSDRHQRLPANFAIAQEAVAIGRGVHGGRNQMALFGWDTQPRTISPIRVERGRGGRAGSSRYPSADLPLPARLTLEEMCRLYPNHVWGSLLRVYIAEGWTAEMIWQALPADYRHNDANTRPWNYIQAAFGREIDQMTREETGKKRIPQKRKLDDDDDEDDDRSGSTPRRLQWVPQQTMVQGAGGVAAPHLPVLAPGPVLPSAAAAPAASPRPRLAANDMNMFSLNMGVIEQRQHIMSVMLDIERLVNPSTSENIIAQARETRFKTRLATWTRSLADMYASRVPGEDLTVLDTPDLLIRVFQIRNPEPRAGQTAEQHRNRAILTAWRHYYGLLESWARGYVRQRGEMIELARRDLYPEQVQTRETEAKKGE